MAATRTDTDRLAAIERTVMTIKTIMIVWSALAGTAAFLYVFILIFIP
jgi:multisubunit Na+/H+ antiporter MnhF subunit